MFFLPSISVRHVPLDWNMTFRWLAAGNNPYKYGANWTIQKIHGVILWYLKLGMRTAPQEAPKGMLNFTKSWDCWSFWVHWVSKSNGIISSNLRANRSVARKSAECCDFCLTRGPEGETGLIFFLRCCEIALFLPGPKVRAPKNTIWLWNPTYLQKTTTIPWPREIQYNIIYVYMYLGSADNIIY